LKLQLTITRSFVESHLSNEKEEVVREKDKKLQLYEDTRASKLVKKMLGGSLVQVACFEERRSKVREQTLVAVE